MSAGLYFLALYLNLGNADNKQCYLKFLLTSDTCYNLSDLSRGTVAIRLNDKLSKHNSN